jgi:hypothetical protein
MTLKLTLTPQLLPRHTDAPRPEERKKVLIQTASDDRNRFKCI